MKSCIASVFLLLAVSGCWATFLHPFAPFGLRPPQQQIYYPPPLQRNFPQEQFLFFPQLRTHSPNPYQSLNFIQPERHPYNFYNPPSAPRLPIYPYHRENYSPVVQYIYQQVPLQSAPVNSNYLPPQVTKDCDEAADSPAMNDRQPVETIIEEITKEEIMNPAAADAKPESMLTLQMIGVHPEEMTSEETTQEEDLSANPMNSAAESESDEFMRMMSDRPSESTSEIATKVETTNPTISTSEPETANPQQAEIESDSEATQSAESDSDETTTMT